MFSWAQIACHSWANCIDWHDLYCVLDISPRKNRLYITQKAGGRIRGPSSLRNVDFLIAWSPLNRTEVLWSSTQVGVFHRVFHQHPLPPQHESRQRHSYEEHKTVTSVICSLSDQSSFVIHSWSIYCFVKILTDIQAFLSTEKPCWETSLHKPFTFPPFPFCHDNFLQLQLSATTTARYHTLGYAWGQGFCYLARQAGFARSQSDLCYNTSCHAPYNCDHLRTKPISVLWGSYRRGLGDTEKLARSSS